MYHFQTQHQFHYNSYQLCPAGLRDDKLQNIINSTVNEQYCHQDLPQNVESHSHPLIQDPKDNSSLQNNKEEQINKIKSKCGKNKVEVSKPAPKKATVDTSSYSIEQRLLAAVWVHERKNTNHSITEIKHNFRKRFGCDPPSKTTLLTWEQKLFSTGNVCDAPRTGRPVHRKRHISLVRASVASAPSLSVRARARALRLPRSTLHHILRHDLPHTHTIQQDETSSKTTAPSRQLGGAGAPALGST